MEIAYKAIDGAGTPLIYLHGWLGDRRSWNQVDTQLHAENPRLLPDQRCHGRSPCRPFDISDLTRDLRTLIDNTGIEQPVLAGHSLGGMVALQYAVEHPVRGLFLAGTPASTPEPEEHSPQYFLDRLDTMDRENWAEGIVANYAPQDPDARQMVLEELVEAGETVLKSGLRAMIGYDVSDRLHEIEAPATVVSGSEDHAITPAQGQELADRVDCSHHVLDASHLMHRERPGDLAGLLERLLSEAG